MKLLNRDDFLSETDRPNNKYLKTATPGTLSLLIPAVFLAAGLAAWFFGGAYAVTVTGHAVKVAGSVVYCLVEEADIDKVKAGMKVRVDDSVGTVTEVQSETGFDYDLFAGAYGTDVEKLHLDPEGRYYLAATDIAQDAVGYRPYEIVVRSLTPYGYYFGGDSHE